VYRIPKVKRSEYLLFDREDLPYLNVIEKFNCFYCSYGNGLMAYGREIYHRNATDIKLVMTDMGMPIMDGYELFYELKKINPKLPIIVSSGYGDAEVGSRIGTDNIAGIISKPYGPDQLRGVLRKSLEGIQ
jgi:DNA-binding NtrC family response regulator